MKRLLGLLGVAVLATMFLAGTSLAGPSRALIQEMGSVIGKDEVNIDLNWQGAASDTGLTVGAINLSSVNIGLADNWELRLGALPGSRSYLLGGDAASLGLTIKAAGFVPGLGFWLGYGYNNSDSDGTISDLTSSSYRLGAAYTWTGPVIVNFSLGFGGDTTEAGSTTVDSNGSFEGAAAVLFPVKSNLILGAELHYLSNDESEADVQTTAIIVPAIGARVLAGNFTIDAIVALYSKIDADAGGTTATTTNTIIGVPNLRLNYKF